MQDHPPPEKRPRIVFSVPNEEENFLVQPSSFPSIRRRIPEGANSHRHRVENLLHLPTIQKGCGNVIVKKYVEKLGVTMDFSKKFQTTVSNTRFMITNVPENEPEGLLAGIFQYCLDETINVSKEAGMEPDRIGCMISSEHLDPDIYNPIREITNNTVDAILNFFLKVAQSKKELGICLWGSPFTVRITAVNRSGLPQTKRIRGGAPAKLAPIHHRIKDKMLIKIHNKNSYCLFFALQATLVSRTRDMTRSQFYNYMHGRSDCRFARETEELMARVHVPLGQKEYDAEEFVPKVVDYWNKTFDGIMKIKVFIFGSLGHYKPIFKYGPEDYDTPLILYYKDNHFEGVKEIGGLFSQPYCLSCAKTYNRAKTHRMDCLARCKLCSRMGPKFPCKPFQGYYKECKLCCKKFHNGNCYRHHLSSGFCKQSHQCRLCGIIYDVALNTKNGRKGHICGQSFCSICNCYHSTERKCYLQPIEPKEEEKVKPCRYISFDIETMQNESIGETNKKLHVPNFISARVACADCISTGNWKESLKKNNAKKCKICGPNRTITFSHRPYTETNVDQMIITNEPVDEFVKWVLHGLPIKWDSYVFAHYGGKFDYLMVFRSLFTMGFNPSMIKRGNKVYELNIKSRKKLNSNVYFRDSYNLMPMKLGDLVSAFNLQIEEKMWFPHLANHPGNYGVKMAGLPPKKDYLYDGMMPKRRAEFEGWYEQHKDEPFFLDNSLASYCTSDCDILMSALVAFRQEILEITKRPEEPPLGEANRAAFKTPHDGIDCLRASMTIASLCMKHFKTNHLKADHLGLVPERGYDNSMNQSLLALKFLQYYAEKNNVHVQTAHSAEGEKKVAQYRLDGWVESEQYGIEINGCAFHFCDKCHKHDHIKLANGRTAGFQREKDEKRMEEILKIIPRVDVYRECEIRAMLEKDKGMREKFNSYMDAGPINIRSAFFGGRTGPMSLYHAVKPGEKISYLDVTSLYPWINMCTEEEQKYPVGHPKVHILNKDVHWTRPENNPYPLAILKVFIIPPRQIDVPIMPVKLDYERLLFPTCAKCALQFPHGGVDEKYECPHSDQERGWVSTCTSVELNESLRENYVVTKVFRVLEFLESDKELFRPYMQEFMAQKFHSSGFDALIRGDREKEEKFVRECKEKFGIEIDTDKMVTNAAKRVIAKLACNNLWGRFSLRNDLSKCHITDDPAELGNFLDDHSIEVTSLDELTSDTILISYAKKKDWVDEHNSANCIISLFTTSYARLHLLKLIRKVARTPGCTPLYFDTDSIIFSGPENVNVFEISPHLGGLTDEFPQHKILEFICAGAKQYGLKIQRHDAKEGEYEHVLKLRGFTLNHDVVENQGLRYETFKRNVLHYAKTGKAIEIPVLYPHFLRPSVKKGCVTTQPLKKIYRPYMSKGIIRPSDFRVLHFGYCPP